MEDDHSLVSALIDLGYEVQPVIWDDPSVVWSSFSRILIRSTWDYHTKIEDFKAWLDRLEASKASVWNPIPLLRWNLSKAYLRQIEAQGLRIVPTTWIEAGERCDLQAAAAAYPASEIVVKPVVSAGAYDTFRWKVEDLAAEQALMDRLTAKQAMMLQPFLPAFVTEGEYSFLFFGGQFSHALQKQPKDGDFRVQEVHGGRSILAKPPVSWIAEASAYLRTIQPTPLYARIDLVRHHDRLHLVEIELIEPSLFFSLDPPSALRLASAIHLYDIGLAP